MDDRLTKLQSRYNQEARFAAVVDGMRLMLRTNGVPPHELHDAALFAEWMTVMEETQPGYLRAITDG